MCAGDLFLLIFEFDEPIYSSNLEINLYIF
jgi:hypothetical protein